MDTAGDRSRCCTAPQPSRRLVLTGRHMTPSQNDECPAQPSICYRPGRKVLIAKSQ
ncbi:unnamed protein product, partial [Staurois parvus]